MGVGNEIESLIDDITTKHGGDYVRLTINLSHTPDIGWTAFFARQPLLDDGETDDVAVEPDAKIIMRTEVCADLAKAVAHLRKAVKQ